MNIFNYFISKLKKNNILLSIQKEITVNTNTDITLLDFQKVLTKLNISSFQ